MEFLLKFSFENFDSTCDAAYKVWTSAGRNRGAEISLPAIATSLPRPTESISCHSTKSISATDVGAVNFTKYWHCKQQQKEEEKKKKNKNIKQQKQIQIHNSEQQHKEQNQKKKETQQT